VNGDVNSCFIPIESLKQQVVQQLLQLISVIQVLKNQSKMVNTKFLTFNNGEKMPVIGIGTWQVITITIFCKFYKL